MSILEVVIGVLAPPTCVGCEVEGTSLCAACAGSEILFFGERCFGCGRLSDRSKTCPACRAKNAPNFVWVATDYEGLAKDLVQRFKFYHQRAAAGALAGIMSRIYLSQNSDEQIKRKNYLLVPIPTAGSRRRQRSFDHTYILSTVIAKELNLSLAPALGRLGHSQQVGSPRHLRASQVKGAYYPRKPSYVKGRNILLVDDVVTTGATLGEAARTLRVAGARSVDALVFAKRL